MKRSEVHWSSPDGAEVVVRLRDVPVGAMRGMACTFVADAAKCECRFVMSSLHAAHWPGAFVKVLAHQIPWDDEEQPSVKAPNQKDGDAGHWPHSCPGCGGPAYIGLSVDCKRKCCPECTR